MNNQNTVPQESLMESLHSNIMIQAEDWALAKRNIDWYHGCVMGVILAWFSVAINLGIENNLEIRKECPPLLISNILTCGGVNLCLIQMHYIALNLVTVLRYLVFVSKERMPVSGITTLPWLSNRG